MIEITIKTLAAEIQIPVECLLEKLSNVGIQKSSNDSLTFQEKQTLLAHLNREHRSHLNKLILQRKIRSTLNVPGVGGKSKLIQIEIRKKRILLNSDHQEEKHTNIINEEEKNAFLEKKSKHKEEFYSKRKIKSETNYEIEKKNKTVNHQRTDEMIKNAQTERARRENEVAQLKRKSEEEAYRKLEDEVRRIAEETRRMAEENENNWNNIVDSLEDSNDYHLTTSKHARQAEDENDREAESGRGRNTRISRSKKSNKHSDLKIDREETRDAVMRSNKSGKRRGSSLQQNFQKPAQSINRDVMIGETITVGELANRMAVKSSQVIKVMMKLGAMVTINQVIDQEIAQLVAEEMGHRVILHRENELEELIMNDRNIGTDANPRAPIVTVMGHVDHGKTSLLDYIRSSKVALQEVGGITQHIGAYHVEIEKKGAITFLDTPGHAAFTAMRARGIQVTDVVVLVIAADDGVMPQTIEAIQHAKAAKVPIIIAINKVDKSESDLDRVKNELIQYDIIPEEWGGDCQCIPVSAKTGIGIDELLNAILLQAEILELKAVQKGMASGVVIESFLDKGRGPTATILVREGTLNKGDIVLCGFEYGRIRAMRNELDQEIKKVKPSIPVEILGLSGIPTVGDEMIVVRDEKKAREVALYRRNKFREVKLAHQQKFKLENLFKNDIKNLIHEVNIVLKADVQGSIEAISDSLFKLSTKEIKIKIIGSGVGGVTETDAALAASSNAILIGFNVRANASARRVIETENLNFYYYSVIYNLIDEMKSILNDMLSPKLKQQIVGLAEVRSIFQSKKFNAIAGCMVTNGTIKRHNPIRVLRNNIIVYEGELESLRHFKEDINEVRSGMECGIGIKNHNDVRIGDIIEVLEITKVCRNI